MKLRTSSPSPDDKEVELQKKIRVEFVTVYRGDALVPKYEYAVYSLVVHTAGYSYRPRQCNYIATTMLLIKRVLFAFTSNT